MKMSQKKTTKKNNQFYLGEKDAFRQLHELNEYIKEKRKTFIGYPCNGDFNLEKLFKWWEKSALSKSPLNEVGDPNTTTLYTLHTHPFENTVMEYFAELYSIKPYWGYITSGGTQGNEQGIYMGRETLKKFGKPILYFSEEAHYSIASLGKVLDLECRRINTNSSGEMDYNDLKLKLDKTRPVLFSLSIGTTFKGAIDRIEIIHSIILQMGIKHFFFHADAALFGGYLPFYPDNTKPDLNFHKFPYDSIAVSGHKFFGAPIPLGIFLIRNKYTHSLEAEYIEYIHSKNLTIPCSRSALNPLILWWAISTVPKSEFVRQTRMNIENAHYLFKQLQKRRYPVWLNPFSNTVFFKAPSMQLCKRWTLALFTCPKLGPLAHAVIMQHVDKPMINAFLKELDQERRAPFIRRKNTKLYPSER